MIEKQDLLPTAICSDEEAEEAQAVVCTRLELRTTPLFKKFTDNVVTTCHVCGHDIFHRPAVPKKPMKICFDCALTMANESDNPEDFTQSFTSRSAVEDVQRLLGKKEPVES